MVPLNGWQLGSGESVSIVASIGFAVDYVVHLGGHYVHSKYKDRDNRIREALREMGISIISGSITTMLSVLILFACVIFLFTKFSIFVLTTIICSTFYSLCFFSACCHVVGPNDEFANISQLIKCMCRPCINSIIKKKKAERQKKKN